MNLCIGDWFLTFFKSTSLCAIGFRQFRRWLMLVVLFVNGWVPWRTAVTICDTATHLPWLLPLRDWDLGESEKPVPAAPCDKRAWLPRCNWQDVTARDRTWGVWWFSQRRWFWTVPNTEIVISCQSFMLCSDLEVLRPHSHKYGSPPLPNLQKQRSGSKGSGTRKEQKQWPGSPQVLQYQSCRPADQYTNVYETCPEYKAQVMFIVLEVSQERMGRRGFAVDFCTRRSQPSLSWPEPRRAKPKWQRRMSLALRNLCLTLPSLTSRTLQSTCSNKVF